MARRASNVNQNDNVTPPAQPRVSARERLMGKAAKPAAPVASKKKDDRPTVTLDGVLGQNLDVLTTCHHVAKAVTGHEKTAKGIIQPYAKRATFLKWLQQGARSENVRFVTPNGASFILQVKDTLSGARGFRVPKGLDGNPIDVAQHLRNNGVPEELVARLLDEQEFVDQEVMSIPVAKLEKENRPLVDKLLDLIDAANQGGVTTSDGETITFSDSEIQQLITANHDVTIKEGFLDRVVNHVLAVSDDQEEQADLIDRLLTAIPPDYAFGSVQPGLNQEEVLRSVMHTKPGEPTVAQAGAPAAAPAPPPPPPQPVEHDMGDRYKVRALGTQLTVIRKRDNKEMCVKTCKDAGHVANSLRQWQTNPAALDKFVADNI